MGGTGRAAHDGRADELRGLGQRHVLQVGDGETGFLDGGQRGAVAVTADDEPVEPVHPVLQPGQARVVGAQVLEEQELTTGPEHSSQLAQRPRLVVHPAQHQRGHRDVERAVLERKVLGRGAQHLRGRGLLVGLALQAAQHRRLRLGDGQRLDRRAVVRQVVAGSAADLEDPAGRPSQQLGAEVSQPGPLGAGHLAVVRQCENLARRVMAASFRIAEIADDTTVRRRQHPAHEVNSSSSGHWVKAG